MNFLIPLLSLALFVPVVLFSQEVALGLDGVFYLLKKVVFAGVFPASVLLRCFLFSRAGDTVCRAFSKTLLFKKTALPKCLALPILAGQLSGFPMGSILIKDSTADKKDKEKALALSSIPSPAFLFAYFGKTGILLYFVMILVLWSIFILIPSKKSTGKNTPRIITFPEALKEGIENSVQVSGTIIFFSSLVLILPDVLKPFFSAILELSLSLTFAKTPLLTAFALSFAGLSVMAQLYYLSGGVSVKTYLLTRPALFFFLYPCLKEPSICPFILLFLILFLLFLVTYKKNTCKNKAFQL